MSILRAGMPVFATGLRRMTDQAQVAFDPTAYWQGDASPAPECEIADGRLDDE